MENKNSKKPLVIFVMFLIILGLVSYILYDKGVFLNKKDKESDKTSENKKNKNKTKIEYNIKTNDDNNQELYVNGNKVEIPIKHEVKEINKVDILDDIIIADIWINDYTSLYAINKEGKVIWYEAQAEICEEYGGVCTPVIGDNYTEAFGYVGNYYKIDGSKIRFISMVSTQDPEWAVCQLKPNDIFEAEYEVEYLGNDKFSKLKVLQKNTADDYIDKNRIACIEYDN